jgi:hypothetical protein
MTLNPSVDYQGWQAEDETWKGPPDTGPGYPAVDGP